MSTWTRNDFYGLVLGVIIVIALRQLDICNVNAQQGGKGILTDLYGDIFTDEWSRSLTTPLGNNSQKCLVEMPAMLFQTEKLKPITGNGSTEYLHRIEKCCPGYKRYKYNWHKCVPDCGDKCDHGFCRAPNKCECFDGFVPNVHGICSFTCPLGCENGRCFLNGTCKCNRGYVLDPTQKFCLGNCYPECGVHEICTGTRNVCACREGYTRTPLDGCQPVCNPECGFGKCVAPNQCECFTNYTYKLNTCQAPFCYAICDNGYCESENKCTCRHGYKFDRVTTYCIPDCGDQCENGVCVAPGECRCFRGFERNENKCVAICEKGCGFYGKCIEPNICGCGQVNQKCNNGTCSSAGSCVCQQGSTRFLDKCVEPYSLDGIITSSEDRFHYEFAMKNEFENLIGRFFHI